MSRIRFGFRTVKVKAYNINEFNITKEEAESFAVPYDGFDIWHTDKSLTVEIPQIEKRVKYFHIMFIPFFPVGIQWTTRNKNGLFKINQVCEQKVKSIYPKSYGPWYSFLAPIICLLAIFLYLGIEFAQKKIRNQRYAEKIDTERVALINELDSATTPFYLVIDAYFESGHSFHRVDSIIDNSFYIGNLKHQIDDLKYNSSDYSYHKSFKERNLESNIISRDSILSMIPKDTDEASYWNKNKKLRRIIPIAALENPNVDFDFHLGGIAIKNLGKPLTLIDFSNNSIEKNRWVVNTNEYIDTDQSIRATYIPGSKPAEKSDLIFIFSDGEYFYEYKVQGTYKITNSFTAFVDTSVEKIK